MLPPVELRRAAELIVEESGAVPLDELVIHIARELGDKRTGAELKSAIEKAARPFSTGP